MSVKAVGQASAAHRTERYRRALVCSSSRAGGPAGVPAGTTGTGRLIAGSILRLPLRLAALCTEMSTA